MKDIVGLILQSLIFPLVISYFNHKWFDDKSD